MGKYTSLANFYIDAHRIATKGETLELADAEALDLMRYGRIEPADKTTGERFRREAVTTWAAAPEPEAPAGRWRNWRN
jgi:hypothetical protein